MKKLASLPKPKASVTTNPADLPAYLTVTDVATLIRRTPRSIYDLVAKKLIPYSQPPGTRMILFEKKAVLDWITFHCSPSKKPQS